MSNGLSNTEIQEAISKSGVPAILSTGSSGTTVKLRRPDGHIVKGHNGTIYVGNYYESVNELAEEIADRYNQLRKSNLLYR